MFIIRWILGRLILTLNFIFAPKRTKRPSQEQAELDAATQDLALYQYPACPFCVKVRRNIRRNNLAIELRNAKTLPHQQTLEQQGGQLKVPCLRIEQNGEVNWMYESSAIINYLEQRFVTQ